MQEWENRTNEFKGTIEVMKEYAYNPPKKSISEVKEKGKATLAEKKLWMSKKPQNIKKEGD